VTDHRQIGISNEEISQWAATRADDAGRLARELVRSRNEVVSLVVAAREFWDVHNDFSEESAALDKALEPFSSRVKYADDTASPTEGQTVKEGSTDE
jgi:hypothetical protein